MKVFLQALDTGNADVDAVDEGENPDWEERRDKVKVTFSGQLADSIVIIDGGRLLDSRHGDLLVLDSGCGLTHICSKQCNLGL